MKLIYLILSVAAFYNVSSAYAQDNFSLWPRRPEALEQARLLLKERKWGEAVYLLQPFVSDSGVSGAEARKIVGRVNVVRYLSRLHPGAAVYVVKRGDTLPKIASHTKCPTDMLMLYNGLVAPSSLKIGQKLVYINMTLRVEIYPGLNELTVWDGDVLVSSYSISADSGLVSVAQKSSETAVSARESYMRGSRIPKNSAVAIAADKEIRLSDGTVISASKKPGGRVICMNQTDLNELALLVRETNTVLWLEHPLAKPAAEESSAR